MIDKVKQNIVKLIRGAIFFIAEQGISVEILIRRTATAFPGLRNHTLGKTNHLAQTLDGRSEGYIAFA